MDAVVLNGFFQEGFEFVELVFWREAKGFPPALESMASSYEVDCFVHERLQGWDKSAIT